LPLARGRIDPQPDLALGEVVVRGHLGVIEEGAILPESGSFAFSRWSARLMLNAISSLNAGELSTVGPLPDVTASCFSMSPVSVFIHRASYVPAGSSTTTLAGPLPVR
jgi:hypothetical protein